MGQSLLLGAPCAVSPSLHKSALLNPTTSAANSWLLHRTPADGLTFGIPPYGQSMSSPETISVAGRISAANPAGGSGAPRAAPASRNVLFAVCARSARYRRFVLLSGIAWLASLVVLWLGVNVLGFPAWAANAAGDTIAVTLVFILYPGTVFGSRHPQWLVAFVPWIVWQTLHIALISWAVDIFSATLAPYTPRPVSGWLEVVVKVGLTPVTVTLNFFAARYLLHRKSAALS